MKEKVKKPITKRLWFWPLIIILVLGVIGGISSKKDSSDSPDSSADAVIPSASADISASISDSELSPDSQAQTQSVIDLDYDLSGYTEISADVLYEYGKYMDNQNVVTVITVASADRNSLKANTENGKPLTYSIVCNFDSNDVKDEIKDNSIITVAGTIKSNISDFVSLDTVTLENCSVVGYGEISDSLNAGKDDQIAYGVSMRQQYEDNQAATIKAERDEYISSCEFVDFSDVERNPDNYKGKHIRISGTVIQVSEGLFNGVILRVDEGNGNTWYVTYTRKEGESRILENDWITCYGESNGVTSYTNVLGSQVTVPSLKMIYFE